MKHINIQYFETTYGELILGSFDNKLCLCDWRFRKARERVDNRIQRGIQADYVEKSDTVITQTKSQLNEYFIQQRQQFSIPLLMVGTDFQKKVWQHLNQIPFAQTSSYLQLAQSIGNKKAVRAVANANGANALSIFIPCHRVIGSNGKIVGYAGGLDTKEQLLQLEQQA